MSFVHIMMYLEMLIHEVVSGHGLGLITRDKKGNKVNHNGNGPIYIRKVSHDTAWVWLLCLWGNL